jgi:hypothetical protein
MTAAKLNSKVDSVHPRPAEHPVVTRAQERTPTTAGQKINSMMARIMYAFRLAIRRKAFVLAERIS